MKNQISAFICAAILLALTACGGTAQSRASIPASSSPESSSGTASSDAQSSAPSSAQTAASSGAVSAAASNKTTESASASAGAAAAPEAPASEGESKVLVAYFSLPETTKTEGLTEDEENSIVVVDGKALGNTQYVAYLIQENTGADIFRIEPQTPYPADHNALTDFAKEEQNQNARPAISANVENLSRYDTVFIGYPNWWGDMPMILYTFFDENDFSGKTIIPFNTHGGSGFSATIATIAELEPNATVNQDGFTISRNNVQNAGPEIVSWLAKLGYEKP